ncbi:VanZ family protein [Chitinibacteraceae bacterium HSL-7]
MSYRLRELRVTDLAHGLPETRLSRYLLICYLPLVVLLSLYPFGDWRYTGEPVLAFLTYPLPFYFTLFDNLANVLAYVPVGLGIALQSRVRWRGWLAGGVLGVLLSISVEFIQQFLPGRIASNLDVLTNGTGAFIGATLGVLLARRRWRRYWRRWRQRVLVDGARAEWGVAWVLLWLITQCDPSVPLFGVVVEAVALPQPFVAPVANARLFLDVLESTGVALNIAGIGLLVSVLVRQPRMLAPAMMLVIGAGVTLKLLFAGLLLKPEAFFNWISPNVLIGAGSGALLLIPAARLVRRARAVLGLLLLLGAVSLAWLWPLTPQLPALLELFRWRYGHLQHFSSMASVVGDLWPYGAITLLATFVARPVRSGFSA